MGMHKLLIANADTPDQKLLLSLLLTNSNTSSEVKAALMNELSRDYNTP